MYIFCKQKFKHNVAISQIVKLLDRHAYIPTSDEYWFYEWNVRVI